ncbi:hypothetical protein BLOT_009824 [Blomia tropicalis]|nr:hypothetical protein BLOT_009824 [Blomia tropicalis]
MISKRHTKRSCSDNTKKVTLLEIADIIEDDDLPNDKVWIEPPSPTNGFDTDIDDASGILRGILVSAASVDKCDGSQFGFEEANDDIFDENIPNDSLEEMKKRVYNDWAKLDLNTSSVPKEYCFPNDISDLNVDYMTPVSAFELFFDEKVLEHLQKQINIYSKQCQKHVPSFTLEELKVCFGVLIISGYCPVKGRSLYWSNDQSTRNIMISNSIRRDRFVQFVYYNHWADNSSFIQGNTDSYFKIRPLIEMMQERFNRSDPFIDNRYIQLFGKILSPMIIFLEELKFKEIPYIFYQDNAFTSQLWLDYCRLKGYFATGTIEKNRLSKGVNLKKNWINVVIMIT